MPLSEDSDGAVQVPKVHPVPVGSVDPDDGDTDDDADDACLHWKLLQKAQQRVQAQIAADAQALLPRYAIHAIGDVFPPSAKR